MKLQHRHPRTTRSTRIKPYIHRDYNPYTRTLLNSIHPTYQTLSYQAGLAIPYPTYLTLSDPTIPDSTLPARS